MVWISVNILYFMIRKYFVLRFIGGKENVQCSFRPMITCRGDFFESMLSAILEEETHPRKQKYFVKIYKQKANLRTIIYILLVYKVNNVRFPR